LAGMFSKTGGPPGHNNGSISFMFKDRDGNRCNLEVCIWLPSISEFPDISRYCAA